MKDNCGLCLLANGCLLLGSLALSACSSGAGPSTFNAALTTAPKQNTMYAPRESHRTGYMTPPVSFGFSTSYDAPGQQPLSKTTQSMQASVPPSAEDRKIRSQKLFSSMPSTATVSLTIILAEPPFDWEAFPQLSSEARASALQGKKESQRAAQQGLREFLASRNVVDIEDFSAVNHILIQGTPAMALQLLSRDDVLDVQTSAPAHSSLYYSGLETGAGTLLANFLPAGYAGAVGHSSSLPVRIGMIEVGGGGFQPVPCRLEQLKRCFANSEYP